MQANKNEIFAGHKWRNEEQGQYALHINNDKLTVSILQNRKPINNVQKEAEVNCSAFVDRNS